MSPSDLWAVLWGPGLHEVQCRYSEGTARIWMPSDRRRPFTRILRLSDCYVSAVPRVREDPLAYGDAHVLWARLDRPECAERLARAPFPPTLVIREGRSSRRTALWALSRPLSPRFVAQANARLSYAFKGRRSAGMPEALILSPFTRLTSAVRPVAVWQEYESDSYGTARDIVGRLSEAPDPDAWRQAA